MFVMCPSAGRSAECCVILDLMVAPRGRALVSLNIGCDDNKERQADIVLGGHADVRRRELRRLM